MPYQINEVLTQLNNLGAELIIMFRAVTQRGVPLEQVLAEATKFKLAASNFEQHPSIIALSLQQRQALVSLTKGLQKAAIINDYSKADEVTINSIAQPFGADAAQIVTAVRAIASELGSIISAAISTKTESKYNPDTYYAGFIENMLVSSKKLESLALKGPDVSLYLRQLHTSLSLGEIAFPLLLARTNSLAELVDLQQKYNDTPVKDLLDSVVAACSNGTQKQCVMMIIKPMFEHDFNDVSKSKISQILAFNFGAAVAAQSMPLIDRIRQIIKQRIEAAQGRYKEIAPKQQAEQTATEAPKATGAPKATLA
jgi:hypothetical protein